MTDHANELRSYSRKIGHPAGDVPSVMLAAADEIERLAAMLEAAESETASWKGLATQFGQEADALRVKAESADSECLEQARLNGMGSKREAALMAKLEAAEKERDTLRAKIEQMERQEPAGYGVLYVEAANGEEDWDSLWKHRVFAEDHVKDFVQAYSDLGESIGAITVVPLYLAPSGQPTPSALAEAIIADMQAQHDTELITENDSGEALIRLDGAIAAVEDNFALAQPAPSIPEFVMEVIAGLVHEVERNICPHEETHRGGQWEICDMCGARWADDRGGKPEFRWPEIVEKARAMLAAAPEAKP